MMITLWLIVVTSLIQGYKLYEYDQKHPQKRFVMQNGEDYPDVLQKKLHYVNRIRILLGGGIISIGIILYCNYKINKQNSIFGMIKDKMNDFEMPED